MNDLVWVVNEEGLEVQDSDGAFVSNINLNKEIYIDEITADGEITFPEDLVGQNDDTRHVTPLRKMASPVIRVEVTIPPSPADGKTTIQFTNAGSVYPTIIPGSRLLIPDERGWDAEYEIIKVVDQDWDDDGDVRWEVQVDDEIQGDIGAGGYIHVTTMSVPFRH